jgi:hypothetical protein
LRHGALPFGIAGRWERSYFTYATL